MFNQYHYIHNIRLHIEPGKMRIFSQYPNMREFFSQYPLYLGDIEKSGTGF